MIVNHYTREIAVKSNVSVAANALKNQELGVIKYLNENDTQIYKDMKLAGSTSKVILLSSIPQFSDLATVKYYPTSFSAPCLYLSPNDNTKSVNAKIIYPSLNTPASFFSAKNLAAINQLNNNSKTISSTEPSLQTDMASIKAGCGIAAINPNSIMIDLNKNSLFSAKKNINTDNVDNRKTTYETVANSDSNLLNQTMATNVYLDTVTAESKEFSTPYCDAAKAQIDYATELRNTCITYAQNNSTYFDGGETITNGAVVDKQCKYTANANFSGYFTTANVSSTTLPQLIQKGQPYINSGCKYSSTQTSTPSPTARCHYTFDYANILNPNRGCKVGVDGVLAISTGAKCVYSAGTTGSDSDGVCTAAAVPFNASDLATAADLATTGSFTITYGM